MPFHFPLTFNDFDVENLKEDGNYVYGNATRDEQRLDRGAAHRITFFGGQLAVFDVSVLNRLLKA